MNENLLKEIQTQVVLSEEFVSNTNKEQFIKLLKKCHRIDYTLSMDSEIKLGASKVGGLPDMPENMSWPMYNNDYLTFFCQINLADFASDQLPNKGIISFFVYAYPERSYSGRRESFKIIFNPNPENLNRLNFPENLNLKSRFTPSAMTFYDSLSYPDDESRLVKGFFVGSKQQNSFYDKLQNTLESYHGKKFIEDKVLGYDRSIQDSAEAYWPINYLNIKTWAEVDERKGEIEKLSGKFVLLLQMDIYTNPSKLASYGGSPEVYFGILKEDLEKQLFENTVLTFQDT